MRIAINAQLLSFSRSYRSGGISRYLYHLLTELSRLRTPHRLTAFVPELPSSAGDWEGGSLRLRATRWPTRQPGLRILWEQLALPLVCGQQRHDLLHSAAYVAPLFWRGPSVVTVYDLSFLRYPQVFNRGNRIYLRTLASLSARRADRVLTISEHTRRDVIELLGVPAEQVVTTYCGVEDRFGPLDRSEVEAYRSARGLPDRYVLYLGTLEPRKNVATLLRAFAHLRSSFALPHKLVLAGAPGWQYENLHASVAKLGIDSEVCFLGFVPEHEQALCYNAADLFAYPSLYEGFGLPVLEAMACGVPVVASNAASLPEVVGDAGIQVNPLDERALSEAMARVLGDAELSSALGAAGLERARHFSWKTMAAQTLEAYEQALPRAHPTRRVSA